MAITKLVFPTSGTPTVPTDYAYQNGYLAQNTKGYNAVSLTNWDATTTAPQVASGSAIEINGATWQVDADTAILTTAATSGINYLVFDDDAGAFGWDDGTPVWSATLNGWYIAGDRFTGHVCTWDGATWFYGKSEYIKNTYSPDDNIVGSFVPYSTVDSQGIIPGGTFHNLKVDNYLQCYGIRTDVEGTGSSLEYGFRFARYGGTTDASGTFSATYPFGSLSLTRIVSMAGSIMNGTARVPLHQAGTLSVTSSTVIFTSSATYAFEEINIFFTLGIPSSEWPSPL